MIPVVPIIIGSTIIVLLACDIIACVVSLLMVSVPRGGRGRAVLERIAGGGASIAGQAQATGAGSQQLAKGHSRGTLVQSYEGDVTAVDTWTAINAQGGTAQTMMSPQGVSRLSCLSVDVALDAGTSAVSVRAAVQVRISGQAFPGGPHVFGGPAGGIAEVTSGGVGLALAKAHDGLNVPVLANSNMTIEAAMVGEDAGDLTVVVTLQFEA
jgi:hypothetical protein